jgi:L-tyrosine isonitrile synthase
MSVCSLKTAGAAGSIPVARVTGLQDPVGNVSRGGHAAESAVAVRDRAPPLQPGWREQTAQHRGDPQRILASFNTWAFKREQPTDPQLMLQMIADSIAGGVPIPFVLYWGKGPRCRIGQPDIECLEYLAGLARRVGETYEPGAAIKLIFTDTHAELNGHSPTTIGRYFGDIEGAARERGFDSCWLGAITQAAGAAATTELPDEVPEDLQAALSASAKKWYRGSGTSDEGALEYYRMNVIEQRAVELAFPRSIFITFNGSKHRRLFPEGLPIFYMYSLRRGFGVKPWFLPVDAAPCGESLCHCAVAQDQGG